MTDSSDYVNLIAVTGGVVHAPADSGRRPLCRTGANSGLGVTGRRRTTYSKTSKHVTCKRCAAALAGGEK